MTALVRNLLTKAARPQPLDEHELAALDRVAGACTPGDGLALLPAILAAIRWRQDPDAGRMFALESAYHDAMRLCGVIRPADLYDQRGRHDPLVLVAFLRDVATIPVLEGCVDFASAAEIAAERLSVLEALDSLDPSGARAYQAERRAIVIEQSSPALARSPERVSVDVQAVRDAILPIVEKLLNQHRTTGAKLTESHLQELIDEAQHALVHGNGGLEPNLSVRIRHGVLENLLAAPMGNADLLWTQRPQARFDLRDFPKAALAAHRLLSDETRPDLETALTEFNLRVVDTIQRSRRFLRADTSATSDCLITLAAKPEELREVLPDLPIEETPGRVARGSCPPRAPSDPDVRDSRIRLLGAEVRYEGTGRRTRAGGSG